MSSFHDPESKNFEGDIVLTKYERENMDAFLNGTLYTGLTRNAIIPGRSGNLWTNGVVPYVYARGHFRYASQKQIISRAMNEYARRTCIRFKPRTTERNFIQFVESGGCSSQVGMVGNMQRVTLGRGCVNFGTVIHELMHAVGFWHEQSRADRDQYVYIYWNNIIPGMRFNFQKYGFNKIQHLGTPYDYCSVMHYPGHAFSANGRPTIVKRQQGGCVLGANQSARGGFSANDVVKLNKLYKCSGGTNPTPKPTPTGKCVDDNVSCARWAQSGECKKNPGYMLKSCRKSCKQCTETKPTPKPTPKPTGTCVDDNTSCPGWAQSGECQKNPGYMLKSCRKSCNQCSTTSSKCVDKNTSCRVWASGGYCGTRPDYMHKNCAKSCNVCGTTTSNCKDKNNQCGAWANGGYCSTSSYVKENCKKACRFC